MKRIFREALVSVAVVLMVGYATPVWAFMGLFESGKNVILIIPDGCSTVLWQAIRQITVGIEGELNVDELPVHGQARTYSADNHITDSAASAAAMACGMKTRNGVLARNALTARGDSLSGDPVPTIIEEAIRAGYATGFITTSMVQYATPAAFYSHRPDRDWFELIALDLVDSGIDVIMGGGRAYMLPSGTTGAEMTVSKRHDSRDLIAEMTAKGYTHVFDTAGFKAVDPTSVDRLMGIFSPEHMEYEVDRAGGTGDEPALWEMADTALRILSRHKKGFFIMIEAGKIDTAAHGHLTTEWLGDGIACDRMVGVVAAFAREHENTLVIVAPDHSTGGPYVTGMVRRNDATTVTVGAFDGGAPDAYANALRIEWVKSTGHTAEDVTVFSMGPGSEKLGGLVNNIDIHAIMRAHLGLGKKASVPTDFIDY